MKWLRNKLRSWLLDPVELSYELECYIKKGNETNLVTYHIIDSVGPFLMGSAIMGGQGFRMIRKDQAKDKKQFNDLWKNYNKETHITWEDGTPYTP